MWDIGGCRCILRNNGDVYKLKELILKSEAIEIVKEYDYIYEPQKDGYKSLHIFVKFKSSNQIIEIQIRNKADHNWATLVEISDLLFDSKLKEYGEDKKLLRFHYLLSIINTLSTKEKYEISSILKEYNYFKKLSEVFSRNYLQVRKQWFDIESQNNHKFFLIETQKDDIPKISSFKSFYEAEMTYFNRLVAR
jgi:putative GTP pyrophosphokinase